MDGVRPLGGKGRRPEPAPRLPGGRAKEPEPARFEVERVGERIAARAPGADRRTLARLRRGEIEPEREVDLHGLDARGAERALGAALDRAWRAGERCVLVIHGRGLRSEGDAVLKEALPEWLARPPHGPRVLAFASAPPRRGGPGATCVLLRRRERKR